MKPRANQRSVLSLAPGFSRVNSTAEAQNRFNGFVPPRQTVETVRLAVATQHPAEAGC